MVEWWYLYAVLLFISIGNGLLIDDLPPDHISGAIHRRKTGTSTGLHNAKQESAPVVTDPAPSSKFTQQSNSRKQKSVDVDDYDDDYDDADDDDYNEFDDYDYDVDGEYDEGDYGGEDYDDYYGDADDYYEDGDGDDYYEDGGGDDDYYDDYEDDNYDDEQQPNIEPKNMAVVFSWHRNTKLGDARWQGGRQSVGVGNEFKVAVLSVKEALPTVPIYIFTNVPKSEIDRDIVKLVTVVRVDLFATAGLDELMNIKKYERIGFGTKPQSLIYGWERGVLPEYVLYLDIDIIITGNEETSGRTLMDVFKPLKHYDLAAVFEGYAIGPRPTPAVGDGWEINTGMLAIKRDALPLVKKWLAIFKRDQAVLDQYISGEQQALMMALEEAPWYRFFPLSSIFNFRRPTIIPQLGFKGTPVVVQAHVFSDPRANVKEYKAIGKHAAVVSLEDSLYHVTKEGGPVHYLCDVMVG